MRKKFDISTLLLYNEITIRNGEETMKREIILASQSPRRKELLQKNGISFQVFVTDADETVNEPMTPSFVHCSITGAGKPG